jgi:peroxiredoxin
MAMPQYVTLYEAYRDRGFSVLAVSQDSPQVLDKVLEFSARMELPFPVVMDAEKKAGAQYRVRSLPTSYLIDQRGHVVGMEIGYLPGREKHLAQQIEALLDAPVGPGVEG